MATPQTLHKFTHLPPELRNIIWELSLPPPRVYDIYPASNSQKTPAQQGLRFANPRSEPPPALAAVCRESRSLALHYYRPLTLGGGSDAATTTTTKFVDLSRDVLLLESCLFERNLLRALLFMGKIPLVRENLRSLAFGTSYGVHTGVWHPVLGWKTLTRHNMGRFLQRLGAFAALERLVFVVRQEVQFEVEELPRALPAVGAAAGCGGWNGGPDFVGNATLYQRGTEPPRPRSLLLDTGVAVGVEAGGDEDASSRASTPSSATSESSLASSSSSLSSLSSSEGELGGGGGNFCRVPWTDDKPWLPHVNEIYYYPLGTNDGDGASNDDDDHENKRPAPESEGPPPVRGPMPTNDDWLRFRRAIKRNLEAGLALGLADATTAAIATTTTTTAAATTPLDSRSRDKRKRQSGESDLGPRSKKMRRTGSLKEGYEMPSIEGASLLWRYSQPGML